MTTPNIDDKGLPEHCLSLRVASDWGHFRRVGRTATKQTYRMIPRTTVAGLLAAIVGEPRDSYYETFGEDVSAIAITPESELRTINMPMTSVGTDPSEATTQTAGSRRSQLVRYQDTRAPRQIHVYETLVDPVYRLDVAVEDEEFYTQLRRHLKNGTSHYPPSLGLSEHLARVELLNSSSEPTPVTGDEPVIIDAAVPGTLKNVVPQAGVECVTERSAAVMEGIGGGRRTTRFDDLVFTPTPDTGVKVAPSALDWPVASVGDKTVVFR
ncbi:type I-B CRISPR-associated protein Cas5b [Halobaculum sp. MBLA0147]|uniref:type I-B CRISPR-associated protein Cas5b n=1 Tax=Halobaculum sp. MBLA0147 TaxID=3079934 RepID=UPI003523491E